MKNKVKNILTIVLIILVSSSMSVMASTFINSKDVIYDNSISKMESTNVQAAVDELYSAATDYSSLDSRMLNFENSLNPDKYIQPTPIDGVTIMYGGYIKIGKIVIVNMALRIDKSKVTLANSINLRSKIMTNFPKGTSNTEYLSASYANTEDNTGNLVAYHTHAMIEDGNLLTYELSTHPYVDGWGFIITGTYLSSE